MRELLKGIFECLDINSNTGLATEDSLPEMSPFQRLFYTQVHTSLARWYQEHLRKERQYPDRLSKPDPSYRLPDQAARQGNTGS